MKTLSVIEASFMSTALIKISAAPHELGHQLDYLEVKYSKPDDAIAVEFEQDAALTNMVSLKKADYVSWFMPQIRALESTHAISISKVDFVFDRAGNKVQLDIVLEDSGDGTNE